MYHVRKTSGHDERSLHIENEAGFTRALEEAGLRTHYTGEQHEVVDDNGNVIAVIASTRVAPEEELAEEISAKHKWTRPDVFLLSAVLVAMIVHFVARAVLP